MPEYSLITIWKIFANDCRKITKRVVCEKERLGAVAKQLKINPVSARQKENLRKWMPSACANSHLRRFQHSRLKATKWFILCLSIVYRKTGFSQMFLGIRPDFGVPMLSGRSPSFLFLLPMQNWGWPDQKWVLPRLKLLKLGNNSLIQSLNYIIQALDCIIQTLDCIIQTMNWRKGGGSDKFMSRHRQE